MAKSRRPTSTPTRRPPATPAAPTTARFVALPPSARVEGDEEGLYGDGRTSPTTRALRQELRQTAVRQASLRQQGRAAIGADADTEADTPDDRDLAAAPLDDDSVVDSDPTEDAEATYVTERAPSHAIEEMPWVAPSRSEPTSTEHGRGQFRDAVAAQARVGATCRLADATVEDVDRLWDWLRSEAQTTFLGAPIPTSVQLHQQLLQLVRGETAGTSLVRSLTYDGHHLGFVVLAPILVDTRSAIFSVYLAPTFRSALGTVLREILPAVRALVPGYALAVWSRDPEWEALHRQVLTPLGFVAHTLFMR